MVRAMTTQTLMSASPLDGSAATLAVHNPATGELLGQVPVMEPAAVVDAVERARRAQRAWGALTVEQRCTRLAPLQRVVLDQMDDIAGAITRENGKPLFEALSAEVMFALDLMKTYLRRAPKVLAPQKIALGLAKHRASYVHRVPKGVVGIISPWNFPFSIPFGEVFFALLAGNAVVLKPSELTPLVALKMRELVVQAGVDPELFHVVTGYGATGAALVDAGVQHVCFTGSVATGRRVGEQCGRRLIPCTLELGGKCPAIVCHDADLDRASQALVWGAFCNHGQACASVERAYVDQRVWNDLKAKVVALARTLRQGPGTTDVDLGANTSPAQVDKVRALLMDAQEKGAVLETGAIPEPGARFIAPVVLTNVHHGMRIMREESFGPILPLMSVRDEQEALEKANDSDVGLLGYVFTADVEKGRALAEQLQAGTVMVNDVLSTFAMVETPWQGVKNSGLGRTHSDDGLRDMTESRHVNYNRITIASRELWYYPYSNGMMQLFRRALQLLYR
jgi:acyl-CoA reductase-like NAD-dependent aldehyde dehydrogenase